MPTVGRAVFSRADREALAVVERAAAAARASGKRVLGVGALAARLQASHAVSSTARGAQVSPLSGRSRALLAAPPPVSRLFERAPVRIDHNFTPSALRTCVP